MRIKFFLLLLMGLFCPINPVFADFGDADFPIDLFEQSPKSYHDAACRSLDNRCRVRFQGTAMWVEGYGGIELSQLKSYRYDAEGSAISHRDYYNYITYESKSGQLRQALFIFINRNAQQDFMRAFFRWKRQTAQPIPNYRLPNSQGPQDTQRRDKGLNPYDNPPIIDFMEKTTKNDKQNINCNSTVWKNKPRCN